MKGRLPFLVALAVAVIGGALALALLVRDEKPSGAGFPVGDDGIAAHSSLSDRTELFGSPLRARLDVATRGGMRRLRTRCGLDPNP